MKDLLHPIIVTLETESSLSPLLVHLDLQHYQSKEILDTTDYCPAIQALTKHKAMCQAIPKSNIKMLRLSPLPSYTEQAGERKQHIQGHSQFILELGSEPGQFLTACLETHARHRPPGLWHLSVFSLQPLRPRLQFPTGQVVLESTSCPICLDSGKPRVRRGCEGPESGWFERVFQ